MLITVLVCVLSFFVGAAFGAWLFYELEHAPIQIDCDDSDVKIEI